MKRINIITGLLLIYLCVMGVIGWPGKKEDANYLQYAVVLALTLLVIILLRWVQIYRLKLREKQRKEEE